MELVLLFALLVITIRAGAIGVSFRLRGGMIFVPVFSILLGRSAAEAVAASLVGVVATSIGSVCSYVSRELSNVRFGMMEITTTSGAIVDAVVAVYLKNWVLFIVFTIVMLLSGIKITILKVGARI